MKGGIMSEVRFRKSLIMLRHLLFAIVRCGLHWFAHIGLSQHSGSHMI